MGDDDNEGFWVSLTVRVAERIGLQNQDDTTCGSQVSAASHASGTLSPTRARGEVPRSLIGPGPRSHNTTGQAAAQKSTYEYVSSSRSHGSSVFAASLASGTLSSARVRADVSRSLIGPGSRSHSATGQTDAQKSSYEYASSPRSHARRRLSECRRSDTETHGSASPNNTWHPTGEEEWRACERRHEWRQTRKGFVASRSQRRPCWLASSQT